MRKTCVLLGLLLALTLVWSGPTQARMWVAGQIGPNWLGATDIDATIAGAKFTANEVTFDNPNVLGGVILGYDFVKEGFLGYDYPGWMKYFSFAIDFTYNTFGIRNQNVTILGPITGLFNTDGFVHGAMPTLSFLFMGRYGFFPDSDVPFGRLQPYVAVGPGIMFTSIRTGIGTSSSTDICLVTEAGIRFMALKNVSLEAAFRYRFASPSFGLNFSRGVVDGGIGLQQEVIRQHVDVDFDVNSFTAIFRVGYHF